MSYHLLLVTEGEGAVMRRAVAVCCVFACVAALPAAGMANIEKVSIVSPPPGHPAANGSSDHATISQDNRDVRLVAYDSAARSLSLPVRGGKSLMVGRFMPRIRAFVDPPGGRHR
jgi:hypothetical protein